MSFTRGRLARGRGWRRLPMRSAVAGIVVVTSGCSLWGWGANQVGQVGDGTTSTPRKSPVQVGKADWSSVSSGNNHTRAIARSDGTLWCWGDNFWGQTGDAVTGDRPSPARIGTAAWSAISAASDHTCGIRSDGTVWCWGNNVYGQIGNGKTGSNVSPVQIGTATWKTVSAGDRHTCGIRSDDTLWCWGATYLGGLQ